LRTNHETDNAGALEYIEAVSGEIQLLALNIAVAAAKMAHNNRIETEVNRNLASLVNQATLAVKHLNRIVDAARAGKDARSAIGEGKAEPVNQELIDDIECVMNDIIRDSEQIIRLLVKVKKG
jgi:hypothetical protein